jgi:hypothetical protein
MIRPFCAALVLLVATAASAKPPSWDKKISGKGRFVALKAFDSEAVLDKETGLVWMSGWGASSGQGGSIANCLRASTGGRFGWRLPLAEEMASLIDPVTNTVPPESGIDLPTDAYWTATTAEALDGSDDYAFVVRTGDNKGPQAILKSTSGPRMLCVRGPGGSDGL